MKVKSSETIVWDKRRKSLTARANEAVAPVRFDPKTVFLTLDEVAKWLRVSKNVVRSIIERKSSKAAPLRALNVAGNYRITKEDLNRWLRVSTVNEYALASTLPMDDAANAMDQRVAPVSVDAAIPSAVSTNAAQNPPRPAELDPNPRDCDPHMTLGECALLSRPGPGRNPIPAPDATHAVDMESRAEADAAETQTPAPLESPVQIGSFALSRPRGGLGAPPGLHPQADCLSGPPRPLRQPGQPGPPRPPGQPGPPGPPRPLRPSRPFRPFRPPLQNKTQALTSESTLIEPIPHSLSTAPEEEAP